MSEQKWAVMCSMTGGWGVARPEHSYREDDGLLACIEWESLHDTWEEAMRYADTQARTVTATLNRKAATIANPSPSHSSRTHERTVIRHPRAANSRRTQHRPRSRPANSQGLLSRTLPITSRTRPR